MTPSAAGKGDDYRPVKVSEYVKNYEQIDWNKVNKKEPDRIKKGKKIYVYSATNLNK
jgi:hypothetical protein